MYKKEDLLNLCRLNLLEENIKDKIESINKVQTLKCIKFKKAELCNKIIYNKDREEK